MFVIERYSNDVGLMGNFLKVSNDIVVSSQFSNQFGGVGVLAVTVGGVNGAVVV